MTKAEYMEIIKMGRQTAEYFRRWGESSHCPDDYRLFFANQSESVKVVCDSFEEAVGELPEV